MRQIDRCLDEMRQIDVFMRCTTTATSQLQLCVYMCVCPSVSRNTNTTYIVSIHQKQRNRYKVEARTGSKRVVRTFLIPSAFSIFSNVFRDDFLPNIAVYQSTLYTKK